MGVFTSSGVTVAIAAAVTATPADATAYAGLTWVVIGAVKNPGVIGDQFSDVTTDHLGDRRTKHFKGQKDGGVMSLEVDLDDTDVGQIALDAAALDSSTANYPIRVTYPNKQNATGANGVRYFCGKVMGANETPGAANSMVTRTYNVGINTDIVKVASTAGA